MRAGTAEPDLLQPTSGPDRVYHLETDASVLPAGPPGRCSAPTAAPTAGGGIVLRGPDLLLVATRSLLLGVVESPTHAEFVVLLAGLKLAREHGVENIRIRVDNLSLVRDLNGETPLKTAWAGALAEEIRQVRAEFRVVDIRWAPSSHATERKDGVPTSDLLARQAIGLGPRQARRRRGRG